jgi:multidrug efflux pump subunit AcrB
VTEGPRSDTARPRAQRLADRFAARVEGWLVAEHARPVLMTAVGTSVGMIPIAALWVWLFLPSSA